MARSNLRFSIAAPKVHFTDADVYTGFNAAAGAAIEPSLTWVDGDATNVNAVNVNGVSATTVLLETQSASGVSFCIADNATLGTVRGTDPTGGNFTNYAVRRGHRLVTRPPAIATLRSSCGPGARVNI